MSSWKCTSIYIGGVLTVAEMRNLLLVSPSFPPLNAADHQRVRMCLPHLAEFNWKATVLCLDEREADGVPDPDLMKTIPEDTEVVRCGALPRKWTRLVGLGSTGLRALPMVIRTGGNILAQTKFDLVFVSTTVFPVMYAASVWKRKLGVPYVLDFQDPWRNTYYDLPGSPPPPGGQLKYRFFSRPVAALLEPPSVRNSSAIVSVSGEYGERLSKRYGLPGKHFQTIPFAGSERDFEVAAHDSIRQSVFTPGDGLIHWVSIGAATRAYTPLIRVVFETLKSLQDKFREQYQRLRIHFVGTNYTSDPSRQRFDVRELAREMGMADMVEETPTRIPYLSALKAMGESDGILAIGNTDPSHTASKIYPVVLSRRPFLAYYHESSSALEILRNCHAGNPVSWSPTNNGRDELVGALEGMLAGRGARAHDKSAFSRYTAHGMTSRLCDLFDQVAERGA
ncbi:MAG: glycosyltransferase [Candidatus Sumerlaeia bacterium]|nr:glycosyltransferase [Candidatus Sumerlaeia bacterium]